MIAVLSPRQANLHLLLVTMLAHHKPERVRALEPERPLLRACTWVSLIQVSPKPCSSSCSTVLVPWPVFASVVMPSLVPVSDTHQCAGGVMAPTARTMADSYWLRQPYVPNILAATLRGLLFNWHGWRPIHVGGVHPPGWFTTRMGGNACAHLGVKMAPLVY
jgi:hypothetical protein